MSYLVTVVDDDDHHDDGFNVLRFSIYTRINAEIDLPSTN